jgi:hypothetical protein
MHVQPQMLVQQEATISMQTPDFVGGAKDVHMFGLSKKEHVTIQQKTQRNIIHNARKLAIIRKNNGQKPYYVTRDSFEKPKPPPPEYMGEHVVWLLQCFRP